LSIAQRRRTQQQRLRKVLRKAAQQFLARRLAQEALIRKFAAETDRLIAEEVLARRLAEEREACELWELRMTTVRALRSSTEKSVFNIRAQ
jgi:hypothetical protein